MTAVGVTNLGAAPALAEAILSHLRSDRQVQGVFGRPARILDDDSPSPLQPYAVLDTLSAEHDHYALGDSGVYRATLSTVSRDVGRRGALALVDCLANALRGRPLLVPNYHIVLCHIVYIDAVRTRDRRQFRGLMRLKIILEETV